MKEIEAKFLNIDIKDIRKKIKAAGGKKIHSLMMYRRYAFTLPIETQKGYARVRQENKKTTMTIKTYDPDSKYANETEVELKSTLEEGKNLLLAGGFKQKAYHETLREKWSIEGCDELCIDCIPGIPTYLEIECSSEANVKRVAKLLNLDFSKAEFGAFDKQFVDYYGFTKDEINQLTPSLTFKNIDKELKFIRKNNDLVQIIKKTHINLLKKIKNSSI